MADQPRDLQPDHAGARPRAAGWIVAAWLAVTAGRFFWAAYDGFGAAEVPWWSKIATGAVGLLAAAAVLPLLRLRRIGWEMAMWVLVTALVMDAARIVLGTRQWIAAAAAAGVSAFCLGYAWRARAAYLDEDDEAFALEAQSRSSAQRPAEARGGGVADALGAIHRRIVEAGSACAVPREALLEVAARYGVQPDALRMGGLPLYRTFLDHFRADGPLKPEESRELWCLERALDLDEISVARMRAEAGRPAGAEPHEPVPAPASATVGDADDDAPTEPAAPAFAGAVDAADADSPLVADAAAHPPAQPPAAEEAFGAAADADAPGPPPHPAPMRFGEAPGLADYEQYELDALLGWAGVAPQAGGDARAALERLRAFHHLSSQPMAEVDAGVSLEPGERCYAARTVELYRMASGAPPPDDAPAAGPVVDPRTFVDGSLERERDVSPYQRAGACRFLLTDRRLLLVAPSGQQSPLPLDRLRAVRPYRNGLEVWPLRGNPVFLGFGGGVDDAAMRIHRALHQSRAGGEP